MSLWECRLVFCLVLLQVYAGRTYNSIAKDLQFDWSIQVTWKQRVIGRSDFFEETIHFSIFAGRATRKLTNTPAVIFSYTFRGRWFIFTNQFLLYYIEQIESLFTATFRSSSKQVLLKFCTIHLKTPQLEYLFNQPEPATYLIRDSDTDAFLWILWNHQEHHFYKTPWGSCFWIYGTYLQHHKTYS